MVLGPLNLGVDVLGAVNFGRVVVLVLLWHCCEELSSYDVGELVLCGEVGVPVYSASCVVLDVAYSPVLLLS